VTASVLLGVICNLMVIRPAQDFWANALVFSFSFTAHGEGLDPSASTKLIIGDYRKIVALDDDLILSPCPKDKPCHCFLAEEIVPFLHQATENDGYAVYCQ